MENDSPTPGPTKPNPNTPWIVGFLVAAGVGVALAVSHLTKPPYRSPYDRERVEVSDAEIEAAVRESDDYDRRGATFRRAARTLIGDRNCTLEQFVDNGGFTRKTGTDDIYFIVCGSTTASRWYLDASIGRLYQR